MSVPAGATWAFEIPLVGPAAAATYPTEWRMVHEGVRWFGAAASGEIAVSCAPPDAGVPVTIDLAELPSGLGPAIGRARLFER